MGLLAVLVGIGVVIWLNGQGAPDRGEIRRVTERPALANPREAVAIGQAKRAAAAREQARLRRVRAARLARRRAAAAAAATAAYARGDLEQRSGYPGSYPDSAQGYSTGTQAYQQQASPQPQPQRQTPRPAPQPQPKRGGAFDDSG